MTENPLEKKIIKANVVQSIQPLAFPGVENMSTDDAGNPILLDRIPGKQNGTPLKALLFNPILKRLIELADAVNSGSDTYQRKGAYPVTNADIKNPDENRNIGIGWIGGWIDDKNVTRIRATDGIEGVVATCADLSDLDNYQIKGNYPATLDPAADINESKQVGISWIGGWNGSTDGVWRMQVTLGKGAGKQNITLANKSDLDAYQLKGAYPVTNADIKKPDENNNIGFAWIGGWIDSKNVTRVRATDGIEGVVATCANLEDLDNYQIKGNYPATLDPAADINESKQVGISWIGGWNGSTDGVWRMQVTLGKGGGKQNITLANKSDLDAYQLKGAYPITNADTKNPDTYSNIGIDWIGGWIDDKGVTRVRATDGIEGVVATCANLEDLDNYQPKGNYAVTFDPALGINANKQVGLAWIGGWNGSTDGKFRIQVTLGKGGGEQNLTLANTSDLEAYQLKGNYVPTNAPDLPADGNGNSGLGWFGFHTANGKTNLLAAGGAGSGNLVETIPSYEDLSAYAKLPNGATNQLIQSGTTEITTADISATAPRQQFIQFPQAFASSSTPDVTIGLIDKTNITSDAYMIWGITNTGFYIQTAGEPQAVSWIAKGAL